MDSISEFLASNTYATATKKTYQPLLELFLEQVKEPANLTAAGLINFVQSQSGWESVEGNSRQCVALAAVRKYLLWKYGHSHPAINARLKRLKGKVMPSITDKQKDILLASFNPYTPKGARDLAMVALWISTGFRLSEMCRLKQENTDTERGFSQAFVKGGKWRFGVFREDTAAHVERWKRFREDLNPQGGYLFVNTLGGTEQGKGLKPTGLQSIVREWGKRIDMKLTPHMFRRGMATISTENGANARAVMAGGGWDSEQMYNKYTQQFQLEALRKWLPSTTVKECNS